MKKQVRIVMVADRGFDVEHRTAEQIRDNLQSILRGEPERLRSKDRPGETCLWSRYLVDQLADSIRVEVTETVTAGGKVDAS